MKKLIAVSTNGSNGVSLVKSVDEQEYNKLINIQEKQLAKGELLAKSHEKKHETIEKGIKHLQKTELLLAKSIYDNYVIRGLLEQDNDFEKQWFDFYFNDKDMNLENAPKEFNEILKKVGNL